MKTKNILTTLITMSMATFGAWAVEPQGEPECVVEQWGEVTTSPLALDINFSDDTWPDTWTIEHTGMYIPEWDDSAYVNTVLPAGEASYPIVFHNVAFANRNSFNGMAAATAAFCRQYYEGSKATTNNDWKSAGHTIMLEDEIEYDTNGKPTKGVAGFAQMCRGASVDGVTSLHGWIEIDHIPYVDRVQWSWSNTSWGRGIKCDIKIGDGDWTPLVWMGSEKQKQGWTLFSDQGYFMDNEIDAHDVSLRWRIWDGDGKQGENQVQEAPFDWQAIDPLAQRQGARLHKVKIYGTALTESDAAYALANIINDPGELTDLTKFGGGTGDIQTPDADAETILLHVSQDGTADYPRIQDAIDAVPDGTRGIIYIAPGTYSENIYVGTKDNHDKYISLIGLDPATTVITSSTSRGGNSNNTYNDCTALNIYTPCFYAEGLTISNTAGVSAGQAEALYTAADAHIFNRCVITGYQDTYKANVGARGYFNGCTIAGTTDFIYDGGLEWFENCEIRCLQPSGYVTAPGDASLRLTKNLYPELERETLYAGLIFNACNITRETGVGDATYYLGRPWQEGSGAMFVNCRMDTQIAKEGWKAWNGNENSSSLLEYGSLDAAGNPLEISERATFSAQLTKKELDAYITPAFLFAALDKTPFDYATTLRGAEAPAGFTCTPTDVIWTDDPDVAGWLVTIEAGTTHIVTEPRFTLPEGVSEADLTIRSISKKGVTSRTVRPDEARHVLAFPTAEGFGKYATGGRGGKVVTVTSLADDGSEGTLRWAFAQYKDEPLTITFAVNGLIHLNSELRINRANWTLAGQSAPGEGITIGGAKVNFGGSQNFIVRNMRFRAGSRDAMGNVLAENAVAAENCALFIFDHCTFGWSVEENMNTQDAHFLTVQHSIVHEGLYNAGHSKGARGYGAQWGGSPATYHHNLLAHNNSRSPRINGARGEDQVVFLEYINNVNYNYGKRGGCYGGENTAPLAEGTYNGLNSAHDCNFMNNYYKPGPYSNTDEVTFVQASYQRDGSTSWAPSQWWIDGNYAEGFPEATADNTKAVTAEGYSLSKILTTNRIVTATPWYRYAGGISYGNYVPEEYMLWDVESAEQAYATVLAKVGPVVRDRVDSRILNEVLTGTSTYKKGVIDLETEAEGFFEYEPAEAPKDTDGDGMPDEWETKNNLDPTIPDNNMRNSEGYTAIEVYLNSLMGETGLNDFSSKPTVIAQPISMSYDAYSLLLRLECPEGTTLKVYALDGTLMMSQTVRSSSVSVAPLARGTYIAIAESGIPTVLKFVR